MFTVNFPESEFRRASNLPLTPKDLDNASWFATQLLQPARRALGSPIIVTQFKVKRLTGVHPQGYAIDFSVPGNDPQKLEFLFNWIATHVPHSFGRLIHERNHLHATIPGTQGNSRGLVFREPVEGEYVLATIGSAATNPLTWALFALLIWLTFGAR